MNIFKLCAAILQDFGHPKNRYWHTQLTLCEKEGFPCFLYLIQIFDLIQPRNRDFIRILPATSSRHLSTTNQRFKQEDSNDNDKNQNDGGNDKQFENMMKFVALTTGGLIVFNVLFG